MINHWLTKKTNQLKLDAILESHYEELYRIAYAWSQEHNLAQDLVQETMLKALQKAEQIKSFKHVDRWLCKIMHNLFYDNCRYDAKWQAIQVEDIDDFVQIESVETLYVRKQTVQNIHDAIGCLPIEQREVLVLVDLQGYSYSEVAEVVEAPVGTVMSRLSRARKKLRSLVSRDSSPIFNNNKIVAITNKSKAK